MRLVFDQNTTGAGSGLNLMHTGHLLQSMFVPLHVLGGAEPARQAYASASRSGMYNSGGNRCEFGRHLYYLQSKACYYVLSVRHFFAQRQINSVYLVLLADLVI